MSGNGNGFVNAIVGGGSNQFGIIDKLKKQQQEQGANAILGYNQNPGFSVEQFTQTGTVPGYSDVSIMTQNA